MAASPSWWTSVTASAAKEIRTEQEINTNNPFQVEATVDDRGALTIMLEQSGKRVTSFDSRMAGNPQVQVFPGNHSESSKSRWAS